MILISAEQLRRVVPSLTISRAYRIAELINYCCPSYVINTKDILHEFLANMVHESGGFRLKEENMNYSAQRIREVWPSRFKSLAEALPYARNPRKLANKVYNGRMGNRPGTDDGYNMRGGSFIQITGRDMYEAYRKFTAFDTIENVADAVRTDDYYAMDSACWLFAVEKKLIDEAIADQFERIVRSINGGTIGMRDRQQIYERVKLYVK